MNIPIKDPVEIEADDDRQLCQHCNRPAKPGENFCYECHVDLDFDEAELL